ncbi:uncharacterized protein J3D65DRAFT_117895 [Phyllosticta citribraziliensis]|uniref:Secreted protein n=1 Tax=Phyllosticta citribraziliensis TaxID=989973 RepID=A0ABR1LAR4_9PEZI
MAGIYLLVRSMLAAQAPGMRTTTLVASRPGPSRRIQWPLATCIEPLAAGVGPRRPSAVELHSLDPESATPNKTSSYILRWRLFVALSRGAPLSLPWFVFVVGQEGTMSYQ